MWLDEQEQEIWRTLATVLVHLPAALDAQLQRDAGMSQFEYAILAALSDAPGRELRMSALARFADGSLARLSQAVGRLERRGWVRRTSDPDDGRSTRAVLTDEGWQVLVAAAPGHVSAVRGLVFDPLTRAQVRQLGEIGRRIQRVIIPDGP
ncbi:MarR family winged helix-turn-helix transcriptional regulator [Cryptosporangium phraense]|uniref:MarR family winged helix-turn-helix transcriptional regulator n=1 Tax=Cryptosporangium phraense TaxID=2593070 RepID=UPI00197AFDD7|nr:MarR family transcriptional regulator [Cryptosporangium phraense]